MKKKNFSVFSILFALVIIFTLSACQKEEKTPEKPETKKPEPEQTEKILEPAEQEPEYNGEIAFYAVTFNANGGECDTLILFTEIDGTLDELPVPTKEGTKFEGWYANGVIVTLDTVFSDTTEVIAKWYGEDLPSTS